ncbi:PucR family transcriptional regulator [Pyramidobacter piscolens]|uniref:PucR family transcriptional regulator n=1 Tax=Pyramidobacter piscolens TaxID=638849 RepID=UPI002492C270|nr:PucR family transcriptional regulator [Pyramidobacter piscolens]
MKTLGAPQAVTVRQIAQLHNFKKYTRLVAGEEGLDRQVAYTTVWESPELASRLEGQEFVFSVGYLARTNPPLALEGFRALTNVVSAMGFKLGPHIDEIPDEFIRIADEKNVPLFEIRADCQFRWLIQSIMAEINLYQASVLMEVNQYFHDLYELAMKDGRDSVLLSQLSERIRALCFLLPPDLQEPIWPQKRQAGRAENTLLQGAHEVFRKACVTQGEFHEPPWHIFPLTGKNYCLGYLVVHHKPALGDKERLMIQQLQMRLTMKWNERFEDTRRTLMSLWNSLLYNPKDKREFISHTLERYGLDAEQAFRVLVFSARPGLDEAFRRGAQFTMGSLGRLIPHKILLWVTPLECVLLCSSTGGQKLPQYMIKAKELLAPDPSAVLSVGPSVRGIEEIRDSYRMAKNCFRAVCSRCDTPESLLYCDDWLFELSQIEGADALESRLLVKKVLEPLLRYDCDHGNTAFQDTLRAMNRTESLSEAAGVLHVHENTLRYRVQRMKDLTGLDLFRYRDRAMLARALFCFEINGK